MKDSEISMCIILGQIVWRISINILWTDRIQNNLYSVEWPPNRLRV